MYNLTINAVILVALFLGFYILVNSKLTQHPYRLYAFEILMRVGNVVRQTKSELFVLFPEIFAVSRPSYIYFRYIRNDESYALTVQDYAEYQQRLISQDVMYSTLWRQGYFFVNMILYLDLYLIIRQPFKPQSARIRYYLAALIFYLALWVVLDKWVVPEAKRCRFNEHNIVPIIVFFCLSLFFLLLVLKHLLKKGTNKNLRKQILLRYVLLFFVVLPDYFYMVFNYVHAHYEEVDTSFIPFEYLRFLPASSTILVVLIRISEP